MIHTLVALFSLSSALSHGVDVDYTIRVDPENELVAVTLALSNLDPARPSFPLSMPEGFAFVRLDEPLLLDEVAATGASSALEITRPGPRRWDLATKGETSATIQYRIGLTHRALPEVVGRDEYEYPYVEGDHGFLVTGTMVIRPHEIATRSRRVHFELPPEWSVFAPWPNHPGGGFEPQSDGALSNDLIAIGAWETRSIQVDDFEAVVAVAPRQPGLLGEVAQPVEDIVRAELAIFERAPAGRYLFLFARPDLENGFGGSPKTASMTLAIDAGLRGQASQYVEHLVAHEFFHTWAAARVPLPDELRWVNEGITDYFAFLVPLRLGRLTLAEFHQKLGETLNALERAGRADRTLEESGGPVFFEGGSAYQRVYDEGRALGAWIDAAIRQQDGSLRLDDLMRAFLNDARWDQSSERPTASEFLELVAEFAGASAAERIRELTRGLDAVDWVELFAEVGVELRRSTRPPTLSLRANFAETTITGIDPQGLGYALGLRDGDRIVEVNGLQTESTADVYAAWGSPQDGRMSFVVERAGSEEYFDEPLRDETIYEVVRGPWDQDVSKR